MSKAKINNINIYYEVHGEGKPLLMIQGLGYSSKFWFKQLPQLSKYFKVIIFDNRDVGRSDEAEEAYTIRDMTEDAVNLLEHIGIEKAHIAGVSMGGLIAQDLSVNNPDKVKKLILMDTHPGGPEYLESTEELWKEIGDVEGLSLKEAYKKGIEYAVTDDFLKNNQETVEKIIQMKLDRPQPVQAFNRQFTAASQFDIRNQLKEIKSSTLVIHGKNDQIVPIKFAQQIAEEIPDAELQIIKKAGHLAFIEKADKVNKSIIEFIR